MAPPPSGFPPRVRVLLGNLPGLLAMIVKQALAEAPDIMIVQELRDPEDWEHAARAISADVAVVATDGAAVQLACQRLLFEVPHLAIVAIGLNGKCLEIYDRTLVREVAPAQLVEVIRDVARSRAAPGTDG